MSVTVENWRDLKPHPIADIFPMLQGEELRELGRDIKANGQRDPIWLYEGMILDGRNRHHECVVENIVPWLEEYDGDDPIAFVNSHNVIRRHLDRAQRKKLAKELLAREPNRSSRSVGKEVGLHHSTVEALRQEESSEPSVPNGGASHYDEGFKAATSAPGGEQAATQTAGAEGGSVEAQIPEPAPAQPVERVTKAGKKAPGRKPLTAAEKKAAKEAKAAAPKPLANDRDKRVNALAEMVAANPGRLVEEFVALLPGYEGKIQADLSMTIRQELARRFTRSMGVHPDF